jgi:hypothetical protein
MPAGELSHQAQLLRLLLPDLDSSLVAASAAQQRWMDVAAALQELADAVSSGSSSCISSSSSCGGALSWSPQWSWAQQEAQLMDLVQTAIG